MKTSLLAAALALASATLQAAGPVVEMYKSPSCGCCHKWAEHMQKAGFTVKMHDVEDVGAVRAKYGMPDALGACHTARVGTYTIEGHVPATDIKRLLREKPRAVGLSAPGMPPASPGMDLAGYGDFDTLLVGRGGQATRYARHTLESARKLD
ncbi:MAG: DUF411 domain-containing protein [Candidatus Dactylopiibacterium sp.]|nr:DUF411 domain-containing protein [Candidatus Dactylopiibacterium sp.]